MFLHLQYFVFVTPEKRLDDFTLAKLPCDEGTVVYNNEPGPEKFVSGTHYVKSVSFNK